METNIIYNTDCRSGLKLLMDESVNCIVTSPPYYGLRDYGSIEQIGLEKSPEEFIKNLVDVFRECKRVLAADGTLWLNIGDSYASHGKNRTDEQAVRGSGLNQGFKSQIAAKNQISKISGNLKPKDLIGIPWMLAFALRADGWYLRQDIIWHKPNPMPESVTDRCTKSHEYIFLLTKSAKYYYDHKAIMTDISEVSIKRLSQDVENQNGSDRTPGKTNGAMKAKASWNGSSFDKGKTGETKETHGHTRSSGNKERKTGSERGCLENTGSNVCGSVPWEGMKANKRSVWSVTTKPFKEAHFATFPQELIVDCIKAGCPEGGVVLDPFMGAGTTAIVSRKLNRNYVGFELNSDYIKISNDRIFNELGIFS